MARIDPVDPERADAKVTEMFSEYAARSGGSAGRMVTTMAHSPALLRGYLDLSRAVKRARLHRRVREQIALAVHARLGCAYCLEAHTAAARAVGVDEGDIELAVAGSASDPKTAAIVAFALEVLSAPAEISDSDFEALRGHGWSEQEIADVVALVALNHLTGAFNLVAGLSRRA